MSDYFAPDGTEIDRDDWTRLRHEDPDDLRVRTEVADGVVVSTIWLGVPAPYIEPEPDEWVDPATDKLPHCWQTMIVGGRYDGDRWDHASREEALDYHKQAVARERRHA